MQVPHWGFHHADDTEDVPKQYRNKGVGDSPALMPLDAFSFADFKLENNGKGMEPYR